MSRAARNRVSNAPHESGDTFENVDLLRVLRRGDTSNSADDCIDGGYNFEDSDWRGVVLVHNEDSDGTRLCLSV